MFALLLALFVLFIFTYARTLSKLAYMTNNVHSVVCFKKL